MSRTIDKIKVYLDYAAATPIDHRVKEEMVKTIEFFGNPSSFNNAGRLARDKISQSRLLVARFLGAKIDEIIFTASGSEANNLAVFGLTKEAPQELNEIVTTPIEHPSVLEPVKQLTNQGYKIHYLRVNKEGLIDLSDLEKKINRKTLLISVIYVNNEIGTIQPIPKVYKVIKHFRDRKLAIRNYKSEVNEKIYPLFHSDACQAAEYLDMNVNHLGVDLLTFNGSKIYSSPGVAVLYKRRGVVLKSLIYGGNQEYGLRAGTENLSLIAGLAKAISLINRNTSKEMERLRDYFIEGLKIILPEAKINGPLKEGRQANNINISIPDLDSEIILLELDSYGISASSGSACTAHSVEPSHVLKAIKVESRYINGALRLSLGRQTTKKDVDYVLRVLPKVVWDLKKRYNTYSDN